MSLYGKTPSVPSDESEDIVCAMCGIPLLTEKSTCPKCGYRPNQATAPKPNRMAPGQPPSPFKEMAWNTGTELLPDDMLTYGMVALAAVGILLGTLLPFLGGLEAPALWQSFMTFVGSIALLGLRRLILKP